MNEKLPEPEKTTI